jgi:hypothetical protein
MGFPAPSGQDFIRCVVRGGQEVEWFSDEKNAGAYIQHVYGMKPRQARDAGIEIVSMQNRGPKPGDAFWTDNYYVCKEVNGEKQREHGVICTIAGDLAACFAPSVFREGNRVDVSGGPLPWVTPDTLLFSGLHEVQCWRWWDGFSGAHRGGYYNVTVPLWRWNGITKSFDD